MKEYLAGGRRVLVLRTFSKIYGLAGLRVGYGIGSADVITAIRKVRRAFDVTSAGRRRPSRSMLDQASDEGEADPEARCDLGNEPSRPPSESIMRLRRS